MVSEKLILIWRKMGWSDKQIVEHCKRNNFEVPEGLKVVSEIPIEENVSRNISKSLSKSGYLYTGFRPSPKVNAFLSHIPMRKKSSVINEAIELFIELRERRNKNDN